MLIEWPITINNHQSKIIKFSVPVVPGLSLFLQIVDQLDVLVRHLLDLIEPLSLIVFGNRMVLQ